MGGAIGRTIVFKPVTVPYSLPTGVIVGTAVISRVTNGTPNQYEWHLTDVRRVKKPRKPKDRPQPVWFRPF